MENLVGIFFTINPIKVDLIMSEKMISVDNSPFKECFQGANLSDTFLLSKEAANDLWAKRVDERAASYFNLPDESWVVSSEYENVGVWIDAYNNDTNSIVSDLLRHSFSWSDNTKIWFCVNKHIIFESSWLSFLKYWDGFIAVEDDCPIVIAQTGKSRDALLFRSIGDMVKVSEYAENKLDTHRKKS